MHSEMEAILTDAGGWPEQWRRAGWIHGEGARWSDWLRLPSEVCRVRALGEDHDQQAVPPMAQETCLVKFSFWKNRGA